MVDVTKEISRIVLWYPLGARNIDTNDYAWQVEQIKSLCAKVREEERERAKPAFDFLFEYCQELPDGLIEEANSLLATYSPGSGPVQKRSSPEDTAMMSDFFWKPEPGTNREGGVKNKIVAGSVVRIAGTTRYGTTPLKRKYTVKSVDGKYAFIKGLGWGLKAALRLVKP